MRSRTLRTRRRASERIRTKGRIGDFAHGVGDEDLLPQSEGEEKDSASELLHGVRTLVQLPFQVLVTNDRPGDEMRKLSDVTGESVKGLKLQSEFASRSPAARAPLLSKERSTQTLAGLARP